MGNANRKSIINASAIEKLQQFDGTGESFKQIINNISKDEKKQLSRYYDIWKLGCFYKLILSHNNDLEYAASDIISQFEETEGSILRGNDPQARMALYYATKDTKYLDESYRCAALV